MADVQVSRKSALFSLGAAAALTAAPARATIPGIGGRNAQAILSAPPLNAPPIDSPGELAGALRQMADSLVPTPVGDTDPYCSWGDVITMLSYFHDQALRHAEQSQSWKWNLHHNPCAKP
jgi:hypothetical protein